MKTPGVWDQTVWIGEVKRPLLRGELGAIAPIICPKTSFPNNNATTPATIDSGKYKRWIQRDFC